MNPIGASHGWGTPVLPPSINALILLLALWSLAWKGLALWRAAKRDEKVWFIVFLIINTAGILEIIYLFLVTGANFSDFRSSEGKTDVQ